MEEIVDLIATNSSPAEVSDKIKQVIFTKAAERIDLARPIVATSLFGNESEGDSEDQE